MSTDSTAHVHETANSKYQHTGNIFIWTKGKTLKLHFYLNNDLRILRNLNLLEETKDLLPVSFIIIDLTRPITDEEVVAACRCSLSNTATHPVATATGLDLNTSDMDTMLVRKQSVTGRRREEQRPGFHPPHRDPGSVRNVHRDREQNQLR